ncbi:iron-sulfur cluster assembly 2 homolog, mitochondrial-like [Antedon mediterranea]|uniref:iron-sulfur cluster assembly 2 homolog, mitochondrial-like n=1 Tax=Antedon mediterranea TaxID=105859 RepID=UPI003AF84F45
MATANVLKLSQIIHRNVLKTLLAVNNTARHTTIVRSTANDATSKEEQEESKVTLSDSCVKQIKKIGAQGQHLRLSVEGGGCSGFQYMFSLESETTDEDRVFEKDGAKLVIDEMSLEYVKGSVVDYQEELIRSAFQIVNNPIAEKGCSCGASFSIKF